MLNYVIFRLWGGVGLYFSSMASTFFSSSYQIFYSIVSCRSYEALCGKPLALLIPAVGVIAFAAWGLGPLMRLSRTIFLHVFIQIFYHALS